MNFESSRPPNVLCLATFREIKQKKIAEENRSNVAFVITVSGFVKSFEDLDELVEGFQDQCLCVEDVGVCMESDEDQRSRLEKAYDYCRDIYFSRKAQITHIFKTRWYGSYNG